MTITRDGKTYELTEDELYDAYKEQQRSFRVEDAKDHCADFNETNARKIQFTDDDYEYIVDRYEAARDCNIDENDTYDNIISDFVAETFNDDDTRKEVK